MNKNNCFPRIGLLCLLLLFAFAHLKASIIYTDIPDVHIPLGGAADFDVNGDGINDIRFFQSGNAMNVMGLGATEVSYQGGPYANGFFPPLIISPGIAWSLPGVSRYTCFNGGSGHWCIGSTRPIAVKLLIAGQAHLGYLTIGGGNHLSLNVYDMAYETCPDTDIISGATTGGGSCPSPIPTLGQWGLIILGFSLLALGAIFIRIENRSLSHK